MDNEQLGLRGRRRWLGGAAALSLGLATGAGSLALTSAPAAAQGKPGTPPAVTVPLFRGSLAAVKAWAANRITVRARSLDKAIAEVQSYSFLGSDQATMVGKMQSDISGLQALDAKIQSDTTIAQAVADASTIFTGFRVYYLVLPADSLVVNVDHVDNILVPDLNTNISGVQADENSSNQAVIGPLLADMQHEVQVASSATSGLAAQLLSFTPADWNSNHELLEPARSSVASADRAIWAAERYYYQAVRYLYHHPTTTTTSTSVPTPTSTERGRLAAIKARASRDISRRVASLNAAIAVVQSKSYLGSDQATLVSIMQADLADLQAVGTKIASATTVGEALADYDSIFTELRVYYLVVPVVQDVIRVDYMDNVAVPALNQEVSSLQGQVNSSNQGVLDPLVSDMEGQGQVVTAATSGLSAQLLTFTPAEWNANHALFVGVNANIVTSNRALSTANRDYQRALAYLRHGLGGKDRAPKQAPKPKPDRDHRGRSR
ncbi:MAG: hypothetical protein M0005_17950 [Actinomycetota bacterium]|jgi:hypothetical protein|nr:hypothetical protein [Actinomycetota bacterium]